MMNTRKIKTFIYGCMMVTGLHAQNLQQGLQALDFDKYESARTIFATLTTTEPSNPEHWYYLGQSYLNLYKEDSARWAYEEGIKAAPKSPLNYIGIGELLMSDNKKDEANTQFRKALDFNRGRDGVVTDARSLYLVANALVSTENKAADEALNYAKSAYELAPKDYNVLIAIGDVYLELTKAGEAANYYELAEAVEPKNPKAFTRVAGIWLRVKNPESTYTDLNKALAIDSNYAPALKLMSEYYYKMKKFQTAKYYYTKYLQNSEMSLANRQRFARILFNAKEYESALNDVTELLKNPAVDIYMYRIAGYSYYEVAEQKKDTSLYRPGINAMNEFIAKINPTKIISNDYEYMGKLYSRIPGNDSLAVAYMDKAISTDPSKIELLREAGILTNRVKRFEQSIYYLETYISKSTKRVPADYYLLGMAAYYGKYYAKADSAFADLIAIKPDYAEGYYWRGNTQAMIDQDGKDTLGLSCYQTYISMAESNVEKNKKNLLVAYNYIAVYYIKKEKNADAKIYLNKILAIDPTNKQAQSYLKDLK